MEDMRPGQVLTIVVLTFCAALCLVDATTNMKLATLFRETGFIYFGVFYVMGKPRKTLKEWIEPLKVMTALCLLSIFTCLYCASVDYSPLHAQQTLLTIQGLFYLIWTTIWHFSQGD